ncbi:MAG: hypothetical protein WCF84_26585 [Anaerolineae bacterium]
MEKWLARLMQGLLFLIALATFGLLAACGVHLPGLDDSAPAETTPVAQANEPTPDASSPQAARGAQDFRVDARAGSVSDSLKPIDLVVRRATRAGDTLTLRVAFENTADAVFYVSGFIPPESVILADADGKTYRATGMGSGLKSIEPDNGFAPGAANVGDVVFKLVSDRGPYELRVPNFNPLQFSLDMPLVDEPAAPVPNGTYAVGAILHSNLKAFVPIELRVLTVTVDADALVFDVSFANTYRQGYQILNGPRGDDTYLLDGEGQQARPTAVSDSLRDAVAPKDGWRVGGENRGVLSFSRPAALNLVRFVFPGFNAATIRFNENGLAEARVTSAAGAAPPPTAMPEANEFLFQQVNQALAQQAQALLANDANAYLATFTPEQRAAQQILLRRAANVPLASYSLELNPDKDLPAGQDRLDNVEVQLRYTLRGISPDNPFLHPILCSFVRQNGKWLMSTARSDNSPPFWWTGDVVQQQSDHFLLFTRPQVSKQLPGLVAKTEAAYKALTQAGLVLDPRYVAFFTADQKDFAQFTNKASLLAGLATWRFEIDGDRIIVHSRAFYINGGVLTQNQGNGSGLQTTITHELTHLVLSPVSRPFTPPWLAEGAAVYFSHQNTLDDLHRIVQTGRVNSLHLDALTQTEQLGDDHPEADWIADEYVYSGATFAFLVEQFGLDKVLSFYRSYALVPASQIRDQVPTASSGTPAGDAYHDLRIAFTASTVQNSFGMTLTDLDAAVQAWLRKK